MNEINTQNTNNIQTIAPATRDRAAINRANAAKSTGPKTEEGKRRSSLNAFKHGLTGQTVIMPGDDLQAYEALAKSFQEDLAPKGAVELHLCNSLADICWRLNRSRAMEHNLLTMGVIDFEDQLNVNNAEAQTALAMVHALREKNNLLPTLSIHGQRLSREFERTLKQLHELQAKRREMEKDRLPDAVTLMQLHDAQYPNIGDPLYDPSNDGFVFSLEDVETYRDRRSRKYHAQAYASGRQAA